jgi:hypothetical protein
MDQQEELNRAAGAALEALVRALVRDELRKHLGPEGDYLMNVRQAPMSPRKLRELIARGELAGFKHGRETFIRASDFRSYIERRPVAPRKISVPEPAIDPAQDAHDDLMVVLNLVPTNPDERRAFDLRLAQRRAGGGERAASLTRAEQEREQAALEKIRREERAARRAAKKRAREGGP